MSDNTSPDRRAFAKLTLGGLLSLSYLDTALAQDKVELTDPTAQALGYVEMAEESEKRTDPAQLCNNCQLYAGTDADEWAGCVLFQNRLVAGKGWCAGWVAKAG